MGSVLHEKPLRLKVKAVLHGVINNSFKGISEFLPSEKKKNEINKISFNAFLYPKEPGSLKRLFDKDQGHSFPLGRSAIMC